MTYSWLQSLVDVALVFAIVWGFALVDSVRTVKRVSGLGWMEVWRLWKR